MKKLLFVVLAFALAGGLCFAEEGGIIIRGGAGIMLMTSPSNPYDDFDIFDFRGGVHGDIMYSMGRFEVGGELGVYMMEIEAYSYWDYDYYFALEIPVNAIVRMNFDRERMFGIEVRGGLWLHMAMNEWESITDATFNIGGRAVLGVFYIGADYLAESRYYYYGIAFEAGLKIPFDF